MTTFRIGCHLSVARGYLAMARTAASIGANTFQFFTRNPRGGAAKAIDPSDRAAFLEFAAAHDIFPMLAHAPYTLNLCARDEKIRDFARRTLKDDLSRLADFPNALYNFHPGSHVGQGEEAGIDRIVRALDEALENDTSSTTVLLETMAGKGSEVGRRFESLAEIIARAKRPERLGVCLDTCHVFDAGYDIANDLDGVLAEFDRVIGLSRLRAVHLNDSKNPLGSRRDRHEKIGCGAIGKDAFRRIVNHPALRALPFYLETPQEDVNGYAQEIAMLKAMREDER